MFRARALDTDEVVAVKAISVDHVAPDFESRLRREPEIQRGLGHENIVHLIDSFRFGDEFFLVMEYVDGRSLARIVHSESGPLPIERARGYFRQMLRALEHLHRLGIIHRDIKPSNVLVGWDDRARLADFGIAKYAWQQAETSTQRGLGTPEYMSPEQARGGALDHRSDIYSLGISLFETLTGRRPFMRDSGTPAAYMEVVDAVLNKPLPDPRIYNPSISDDVVRLLRKATAKSPDDRFQSCAEMLGALEVVGVPEDRPRTNVVPEAESTPTVVARQHVGVGMTGSRAADEGRDVVGPSRAGRSSNPWPWILLVAVFVAVGSYLAWPALQRLAGGGTPPPGSRLNDTLAMVISKEVASEVQRFTIDGNPAALATLYGDKGVRFFNMKSATRKGIAADLVTFQKRIVTTTRFDIEVRRAHAVTDSLVETEWIISYERIRNDSTILRGTTSNLLKLQLIDDEWLIVSQTEKWTKRENVKMPVTASIDSSARSDTTPEPMVTDIEPNNTVTDEVKRGVVESTMKGLERGHGATQIASALSATTPPSVRETLVNDLSAGTWRLVSTGPDGDRWAAVADVVAIGGSTRRYRLIFTIVDDGGPRITAVEARERE